MDTILSIGRGDDLVDNILSIGRGDDLVDNILSIGRGVPSSIPSLARNFDLIVLSYMDILNKTTGHLYIEVHEAKKALIEDISQVNRAHLTVLVSVLKTSIYCVSPNYKAKS